MLAELMRSFSAAQSSRLRRSWPAPQARVVEMRRCLSRPGPAGVPTMTTGTIANVQPHASNNPIAAGRHIRRVPGGDCCEAHQWMWRISPAGFPLTAAFDL